MSLYNKEICCEIKKKEGRGGGRMAEGMYLEWTVVQCPVGVRLSVMLFGLLHCPVLGVGPHCADNKKKHLFPQYTYTVYKYFTRISRRTNIHMNDVVPH